MLDSSLTNSPSEVDEESFSDFWNALPRKQNSYLYSPKSALMHSPFRGRKTSEVP